MKVHERIYQYIQEEGLKQYVVANKAGFGTKKFNAMMNGKRKIYAEDIEKICAALEVSPNKFIKPKRNNRANYS